MALTEVTITIRIAKSRLTVSRATNTPGDGELLLSALAVPETAEEAARHTAQLVGHEVKRAIAPASEGDPR